MSALNEGERRLFDELREASPMLRVAVLSELAERIGATAIPSLERVLDTLLQADKGKQIVTGALKGPTE
jgi:hypothetical protein